MRPESVEIKVTLAGGNVDKAITRLELPEGKGWRILFCEDVTAGVAPLTPLLDIGVILRARKKPGTKGDSTVKLRPCRWSQLSEDFFTNRKNGETELKIEADWAGPKRTLTASLTTEWDDDRVDTVRQIGRRRLVREGTAAVPPAMQRRSGQLGSGRGAGRYHRDFR